MPSTAKPLLGDVVDRLGLGWAQGHFTWIGGGVWLADGAELLLIGSITRALSKDWDLSSTARGMVVSIVFFGVLCGNAAAGHIGDTYGRRISVLVSYACIFIFSVLSALTWDIWSMGFARLMVGAAFGLGQPTWTALCSEVSPTAWRTLLQGVSQIMFCVGEMYSAALIWSEDPELDDLSWRWLLVLGSLPSLALFVSAYLFLPESPSFLSANNRHAEAVEVLQKIASWNGVPNENCEFKTLSDASSSSSSASDFTLIDRLRIVCGPQLGYTTWAISYSCFVLNFVYYGGIYAFPQVLPELNLKMSPAAALFFGAMIEVPGFIVGIILGERMTRKSSIELYLGVTVVSVITFLYGVGTYSKGQSEIAILVGYFGMKAVVNVGFLIVYLYASEVFPTAVRSCGIALCLAAGRLGAMACPLTYEYTTEAFGGFDAFFNLIAVLCIVNSGFIAFLSIETAGRKLDYADELMPLKP